MLLGAYFFLEPHSLILGPRTYIPFSGGLMRRKEFAVREPERINEVLKAAEIGYLAFNGPDGWPRITPLNFVYDGRILWHGAVAGERFACLRHDPRATFTAVSLQLYLPSHFLSEENATSATVAFKSVLVRGRCKFIEDPEEKCFALNRLMEKYQPEGRFKRISPNDPMYEKVLRATGVFALTVEEVSGKFKFVQNKSKEDREKIIAQLKEKGSSIDLMVAKEIGETLR
jgi:nitroimidazol reductase NimA-like FMN-containing flavoprotein (pyridoxamine 5'-phosphate oxidase superfamily)